MPTFGTHRVGLHHGKRANLDRRLATSIVWDSKLTLGLCSVSCTSITTTFWISGEETLTYSATTYETEAASTVTFTNTGVVTTYTYPEYTRSDDFAEYVLTYNPCFPNLSVPPEVLSVDELWTKCSTGYGFQLHDPPYVLSHVSSQFSMLFHDKSIRV